eukprot:TRINITY_DN4576_c0_g2_i1.p1 TRINITY_DN4576_c0_g2~~TRINITY_DN4576_c0_g2_i1.p1  ORF type:complete len:426 (+),score=49.23 TRINITY_DN4576_c0_g2_i1:23-1279(+)
MQGMFRLNRIKGSSPQPRQLVDPHKWFHRIAGVYEDAYRLQDNKQLRCNGDDELIITNAETGVEYRAGRFYEASLGEMAGSLTPQNKSSPHVLFEIITRADNASIRYVDVAGVQAQPESRLAVFQAASNFNGVEAVSEGSYPDRKTFTTDYIYDPTQGPAASISAGAAAITRVHAAFYDESKPSSEWGQTKNRQVNFLSEVAEHFPIKNGYVIFTGEEPPFPTEREAPEERKALLYKTKVGYHKNVQVTTGHNTRAGFESVDDPEQIIDQVFCAAANMSQGMSGMRNSCVPGGKDKASFILDSAYQGTYLAAIKNRRSHIALTLIGGGVFGNKKSDIYGSILKAHTQWGNNVESTLQKVTLVLFSSGDVYEPFTSMLQKANIPYNWYEYVAGEKRLKDSFQAQPTATTTTTTSGNAQL